MHISLLDFHRFHNTLSFPADANHSIHANKATMAKYHNLYKMALALSTVAALTSYFTITYMLYTSAALQQVSKGLLQCMLQGKMLGLMCEAYCCKLRKSC